MQMDVIPLSIIRLFVPLTICTTDLSCRPFVPWTFRTMERLGLYSFTCMQFKPQFFAVLQPQSRTAENRISLKGWHCISHHVMMCFQRYGPSKPLPVIDATASPTHSYSRYSVRSVSALIARLVSSSVRFNADLPLANVFAAGSAHLLPVSPARNSATTVDNKVSTQLCNGVCLRRFPAVLKSRCWAAVALRAQQLFSEDLVLLPL